MSMYDVSVKIIFSEINELNSETAKCFMCGRDVTPGNAVKSIRETSWFDWDDPDEDAQGQRRYKNDVEWYCCGFDDGFGTLDCYRSVLAQGIDAKTEALIRIATDDVRADVKNEARALLEKKSEFTAEIARVLEDNEKYSQYDDNSPGAIGI